MRAIILTAFGSTDHFRLAELPWSDPEPGEVRIRIHATSLNPFDYQRRQGAENPGTPPLTLGSDVADVVEALGSGVTVFAIGDEVYAYLLGRSKTSGAYAEYVCLPANFVARKLRNLSVVQAAAVPTSGLTVYQCLERARLMPGAPIFIASGSGGVGTMAIQLARHAGARPIFTTAGSEPSTRYLMGILGVAREHVDGVAALPITGTQEALDTKQGQQDVKGQLLSIVID
jgi:NADPH2:quinone reductase